MKKRIGIFGGTFDPVHLGHLITAEAVRDALKLEQVIFIPAAQPPHKLNRRVAPAAKRLKMTELAIRGNPFFSLSDMELRRSGPSYSVDTLRLLRETYGGETELYFITGADAVNEIHTWHEAEDVLAVCYVTAATRGGTALCLKDLEAYFGPAALRKILPVDTPAVEISSTDIRKRLAAGKSIRYLVPPPVAKYIYEEGLYS